MPKKHSKLGRNPLAKVQTPPSVSTNPLLNSSVGVRRPAMLGLVAKLKELEIQVDWPELYRSVIEERLRKISRFF